MSDSTTEKLIALISPLVEPMGYEIVYLEVNQRQKTLRLFIDWTESSASSGAIGIADCVKVTRALDEPLDQMPEVDQAFGGGGYELEVSSPGIDRPLRTARDYEKFKGREVRVHTFRPLSGEEMGNTAYQAKNPKQKNFLGELQGLREGRVLIALNPAGGHDPTQAKTKKSKVTQKSTKSSKNSGEADRAASVVTIPLPLISKANLEPDFSDVTESEEA
jgi:ribosome maturation factor RimP